MLESYFWKKSEDNRVELDYYIETENVVIGIEAKYNSGLSGEDQLEIALEVVQESERQKLIDGIFALPSDMLHDIDKEQIVCMLLDDIGCVGYDVEQNKWVAIFLTKSKQKKLLYICQNISNIMDGELIRGTILVRDYQINTQEK